MHSVSRCYVDHSPDEASGLWTCFHLPPCECSLASLDPSGLSDEPHPTLRSTAAGLGGGGWVGRGWRGGVTCPLVGWAGQGYGSPHPPPPYALTASLPLSASLYLSLPLCLADLIDITSAESGPTTGNASISTVKTDCRFAKFKLCNTN